MSIKAILLDIEGTTAPISFVAEVLFPYAAERLPEFVRDHAAEPEIAVALKETAELEGRALTTGEAADVLLGWIRADRKATPLKTIQGKIWREGYESGAILAPVYPDAVTAMRAWKEAGKRLDVYSSGSVEAQLLLYRHTKDGDLTPLFTAYFDTKTGPKMEAASYAEIARQITVPPEEILFLSDATAEVSAALEAGMTSWRIDRTMAPGTSTESDGQRVAADFAVVERWLKAE